ncbi:putative GATA transcription factor 22 [Panicum miliaceum]|uniref:GATA transcription factor 22 n=1 Tax=Panicum miliaceum TaxID=4540 RepID=A0A3L6S250_PANMI|nr:putative GATA transcription factor 22 [Panicum miliaceum]
MSAIYMSQLSTALPLMEGDHLQDHHHHHHQGHFQAFTLPKDPPILFPFVISSSSSASDSSLSYGSAEGHHLMFRQQHQAMLEPQHMIGGSSSASVFATPFPTVESIRDDMIEPSAYDPYDMGRLQVGGSLEAAGSWTPPAKMRITRKATGDPGAAKKPRGKAQGYEDMMSMGGQPNLGVIRVCSDCNTTKTPLWRSGPCGPKSLCNACGIRQRKARRAMMASSSGSGPVPADGAKAPTATPRDATAASAHPKVKKEKRVDVDRSLPFKKRGKVVQDHAGAAAAPPAAAHKAIVKPAAEVIADDAGLSSRDLVDNIGLLSWSRSPSVPPSSAASCSFGASPGLPVQQDEITDAAMLLMTLSCGLVRS